jgi:hypothetical protein
MAKQPPGLRTIPKARSVEPHISGFSPALESGISTTSHPTVLGTASPYSLVTLYLNGTAVGSAFADATGHWAVALTAQLNGTFNLVARSAPASSVTSLVINDPKQPLQNLAGVPAVFELDNERGLYFTNSVPYADLTSLIDAIAGSGVNGGTFAAGGFVDPAATNLLTNGTFDTTTTGWTASGSGAMAIASGELQFTVNVSLDAFSQTVAGYGGRAFAFTGTGRRGTVASSPPTLAATTQNAALGGNITTGAPVTSTNATSRLFLSAVSTNMYLGVRGSSGLGTSLWDNFSLVEAMPLQGWSALASSSGASPTAFSVVIDAVAPASLPTSGNTKVIWQADTNTLTGGATQVSQRDQIRLHWAADGTVHFVVRANNTQILDFTLGAVAAGARFRVAIGCAAGANGDSTVGFAASLNGANIQLLSDSVTKMVGVSHMRIGQEANGTGLWDGTFNRIAIVRDRQLNDWLEYQATLPTATPRVFAGDSYMGGASGVVLPNLYETATGHVTYNIGVGGSTFQQQVGYITSRPYLRALPMVAWDGSNNGMVDVTSQVALAQQIWDWKANGRVLFMPSLAVPNPGTASSATPSTTAATLRQYRDALIAAFGATHVYDPVPVLQALSTGSADDANDVAAGLVPRSILLTQNAGEVHLGTAAMTAIAQDATFQTKIAAI